MTLASAEKLEQTGSAEKERMVSVLQCEQLAKTPQLLLLKETRQNHRSKLRGR